MSRIDRLPPSAKQVLQMAATIGSEQPLALPQGRGQSDGCGSSTEPVAAAKGRVFYRKFNVYRNRFTASKHILTQETVYTSLLVTHATSLPSADCRFTY